MILVFMTRRLFVRFLTSDAGIFYTQLNIQLDTHDCQVEGKAGCQAKCKISPQEMSYISRIATTTTYKFQSCLRIRYLLFYAFTIKIMLKKYTRGSNKHSVVRRKSRLKPFANA